MKIKKSTLYAIGILIILVLAAFALSKIPSEKNTNQNPPVQNGEVQKVIIGVQNLNYYPNTIRVKANQPVEISLDESVSGCLRSFTIREFGINEYLATPEDKITFTPTKKGTFRFACSMGMGTGTLIVE